MHEGKGVRTYETDGTVTEAGRSHTVNASDVYDGEWKANRRHGACRYTFFNGEVYACTFVDGVCREFDARQAAVRAAPDAASAQARTEADAAAKAEAKFTAFRCYFVLGIAAAAAAAAAFIRFKRR
jgi:hypothetical protein